MTDLSIDLAIDWKQLAKELKDNARLAPWIAMDVYRKVNAGILRKIKAEFAAKGFKKRKENGPYKNIKTWAGNPKTKPFQAGIYIKRAKGMDPETGKEYSYYAYALENGAHVEPKDPDGWLTFKVNGEWKKVKQVDINPQLGVWENWRDWWSGNPEAQQIADAELQRQLNKIYQRSVKK